MARLERLVEMMAKLRGESGCPWDKDQDHKSLRPYVVEEAWEVVDAIDSGNMHNLREELGDLLLQVVFHAEIAKESGHFDVYDVIDGICDKLVRRHPHVFGDLDVRDAAQVSVNWEKIKAKEKNQKTVLGDIPKTMSELIRARVIQEKAARVGFDWPDERGPLKKLAEEQEELLLADRDDGSRVSEEVGDLLFAVVNVARHLGIDPETALHQANEKFMNRFTYIEEACAERGVDPRDCSLEELDKLWDQAKIREKT